MDGDEDMRPADHSLTRITVEFEAGNLVEWRTAEKAKDGKWVLENGTGFFRHDIYRVPVDTAAEAMAFLTSEYSS